MISIKSNNLDSNSEIKNISDCKFLVRADGNTNLGLGHLMRVKTITDYMWENFNEEFIIITKNPDIVESIGVWRGLRLIIGLLETSTIEKELEKIKNVFKKMNQSSLLIIDLRDPLSEFYGRFLYKNEIKFISIGNTGFGTFFSHSIVIGSPHEELHWIKSEHKLLNIKEKPEIYDDVSYVIINTKFWKYRKYKENNTNLIGKKVRVLVSYGGSDKSKSTLPTLESLYHKREFLESISVVLGPAIEDIRYLKAEISYQFPEITIYHKPLSLAQIFNQVDIAFVSFGSTLYEASYLGVVCFIINPTPYHLFITEKYCHKTNTAINLGLAENFNYEKIWNYLTPFLDDRDMLSRRSKKAMEEVDGLGLKRIVKIIYDLVEN